jgi:hypothetical protein
LRQTRYRTETSLAHNEQQPCRIGVAPFRGEVVMHDARTGRLFQLNHTAARVWRSLRAGIAAEAIVDEFVRLHDAKPATVRRDLEAFVDASRRAGLVAPYQAAKPSVAEPDLPRDTPALDAVYRVGEVAVRVSCYPAAVAAAFAPLAAPARLPDGPTEVEARLALFRDQGAFVLRRDDRIVEKPDAAPAARWALVRHLVSAGGRGRWLALLHAGAVATPAGCLLICGESGAGKSTLLAGLVHAGFAFVADDIVPLEEGTGLVRPVPLAMSIKQGSWPLVGPLFPELADAPTVRFGGRTMRYLWPDGYAPTTGAAAYRVAGALFPRYAGDSPATLSPLDPVRSLALLGQGGSILPYADDGLAEFLAWWSVLPAYQLTYGRLDEAVAKASALIDRLRQGSESAASVAPAPSAFMAEA